MEFIFFQIKAHTLPQGEIIAKIIKIYGEYFNIFYITTTGPVSIKLGIKHLLVEEIHYTPRRGYIVILMSVRSFVRPSVPPNL